MAPVKFVPEQKQEAEPPPLLTPAEIASSNTYDALLAAVNDAILVLETRRKNKVKQTLGILKEAIE